MFGNLEQRAVRLPGCQTSKILLISCIQSKRKYFQGLALFILLNVSGQQSAPVKC